MTLVERVRYVVTANNAPAETTQAWQAGANYLPDDKRVFGDRIYVCAKANKGEKNPTQTVDEWVDMGAINPKRFEDEYVNTQTKSATALNLTLNIPSGFVNSFAFFNTDGRKITILDRNDAVIFEKELTVRDVVSNWWQYFFGGSFSYRNDVWRVGDTDYGGQIKIKIEPNEKGSNLGHLVIGKKVFLGKTLWEPEVSNLDYSKKITDDWGNTKMRKGKTAKYVSAKIVLPSSQVDFVNKTLQKAAGELNLFIGDEREDGFECLSVFGAAKDASITITNSQTSELNLNIEGVI